VCQLAVYHGAEGLEVAAFIDALGVGVGFGVGFGVGGVGLALQRCSGIGCGVGVRVAGRKDNLVQKFAGGAGQRKIRAVIILGLRLRFRIVLLPPDSLGTRDVRILVFAVASSDLREAIPVTDMDAVYWFWISGRPRIASSLLE